MMTAVLTAGMLAGCSSQSGETTAAPQETAETEASEETTEEAAETEETAGAEAAEGESEEILIAAAASLKNAFEEELIPMFQE